VRVKNGWSRKVWLQRVRPRRWAQFWILRAAGSPELPIAVAQNIESASALCARITASRRAICPFPFCKPASAASSLALEFRHSSAALWTYEVQDGRDDVSMHFARQGVKRAHSQFPIKKSGERQIVGHNNGIIPRGVVPSVTLRTGWLRSPFVPNHSAASLLGIMQSPCQLK